ncbi:hypothetical protein BC939DRAFT_446935 [Gamsiella multidivaricata]|uniref:uncharacterized protein n=1 Tax=Gamsiella multidivaricata TaxID=101098 RepID=UPI00221FF29A|nr:uncharacterized protein BC939DRAFT_446935 [Gamsiella multidivaricata]KAG0370935.1 hypothetical protein BGZ54_002434 [Gamsiella multidivaricata]KAI7826620.1 hypothetical protein BC939DRAFT_446935 [Gamsiella multidivaricata]
METAEHSTRPPPLPAKLRWRPYSNGTTIKPKKHQQQEQQQEQQQHERSVRDLNPKALAHNLRRSPPHTPKAHPAPVAVQLQWEEAETIDSMSHGGHPHNQLHHHYHPSYQRSHTPSDTETDSTASSLRRAGSSLPSPPPSQSPISRLALLEGDSDFGQYKASVPALTGYDFSQHGIALPKIENNTVYQVALNTLLENHRKNQLLDAQAPSLALTSVPAPVSLTSPPMTLSDTTLNYSMSPLFSGVGNNSQRKLSTSELLGISNIDDLLISCGYMDVTDSSTTLSTAANTLVSPATTNKSLHSSPVNAAVDFSASDPSSSALDLAASYFDMLVAQTPVLLAEGDSKQLLLQQQHRYQQQQQQSQASSPTLTMAASITDSFTGIFHDLASPFTRLISQEDTGVGGNNPSTWSSLFPKSSEDGYSSNDSAPRVDMATQTDLPYGPEQLSSSPSSGISAQSPSLAHVGLVQDDMDSEWLAFLDEASPLVSGVNGRTNVSTEKNSAAASEATSRLTDQAAFTPQPKSSNLQDKGLRNWAGDYFTSAAMAPTGHRGLSASGPISSLGGGSGGSLIRTLQGNHQQRSNYHTKTSPARGTFASGSSILPKNSSTLVPVSPNKVSKAKPKQSEEPVQPISQSSTPKVAARPNKAETKGKQETKDMGGLLAMFRGLWRGDNRGQ